MKSNTNETIVVKVTKKGTRLYAHDNLGNNYTDQIRNYKRKNAFETNKALKSKKGSTGKIFWKQVPIEEFETPEPLDVVVDDETAKLSIELPEEHSEILSFVHNSYKLKPTNLFMPELNWKYLVRTAVRGKNVLITGPSGSGKTLAARSLVKALDRPDYYFNLGSTQDPRATLIGNTHFNKEDGTYFSESLFVKSIRTENAVILLDELSRAHPEAWNILMTVLDEGQRYLRLDEKDGQSTVKVAKGVTFIATANVGHEYTSTRIMDRALLDRFTRIEMKVLDDKEELALLKHMYPDVDKKILRDISEIAHITREEALSNNSQWTSGISTRTSVELAGLIYDGFSLREAAEVTIYPQFDATGGADSERTFIKQLVQKYCDDGTSENLHPEK